MVPMGCHDSSFGLLCAFLVEIDIYVHDTSFYVLTEYEITILIMFCQYYNQESGISQWEEPVQINKNEKDVQQQQQSNEQMNYPQNHVSSRGIALSTQDLPVHTLHPNDLTI